MFMAGLKKKALPVTGSSLKMRLRDNCDSGCCITGSSRVDGSVGYSFVKADKERRKKS